MAFQWFSLQSIFSMAYFQIFDSFWNQPFHFWLYDTIKNFFLITVLPTCIFFLVFADTWACRCSPSFSSIFPYFLQNFNFSLFCKVGGLEVGPLF